MEDNNTPLLNLRTVTPEDYEELAALMDLVFPDVGGAWPESTIMELITQFPDGQICIEDSGKIIGAALTIKVDYSRFSLPHTYTEIVDENDVAQHNPNGDAIYGLDVFVHPDYRGLRLGRRLYEARKDLCRGDNLKAILTGGRIPGFRQYSHELKVSEYIEKVKRQELHDPILSFQLSNDFDVKRLMRGYLPEDEKSQGYGTLLEWDNIFYEEEVLSVHQTEKTIVRIGVVQWQMRHVMSIDDLVSQAEFFITSLANYQSDFALLPEFFSAPLMGLAPDLRSVEAMRYLSEYSDEIIQRFSHLAVTYNINIIAGSLPVQRDGHMYNVAYMLHRDGSIEEQYKIHITPHEQWSD